MSSRAVFITCIITLAVTRIGSAQFPADSVVQRIVRERVEQGHTTGIVVGLLEPDGGTRIIAYNERKHGEPAFDARTVFEIGSITKAFTGALLAEMVARGEVKLDDPVAKYLPRDVRLPVRGGKQITLLDLATQSSALPRMPGNMNPADPRNPYADYTVEQMYAFLASHELRRDIGAQYEYSNLGFGLLGQALALRAGQPYEQLLRERILVPFGMTNTGIVLTPAQRARLAPGHNAAGDTVANWDLPALAGAGALRSTVEDMLKFLKANLDTTNVTSRRIRGALVARRPAGGKNEIGLGWHIAKRADRQLVWHNGGTAGYQTFAGFDPAARRGVVVLTNSAASSDDIGIHLLDPASQLASRAPRVQRTAIQVAPDVLQRYVGEYELTPAVKFTVTLNDSRLFGQVTGQPAIQLWPESPTNFFVKEVDAQIRFDVDSAGRLTSLTLFQNGQTITARKVR